MSMRAQIAERGTGLAQPLAINLVGAALAAKILLLFLLAYNSRFVMDEFWQFGQAKYLFDGFFDSIWPAKAVGYAAFYRLAHAIGWDAQSMLLAGRLQTALLGCATIVLVYAMARALGEERSRALILVLLLLCFSTFMERIFRTRSEPLALFFAASALLVTLRGRTEAWQRLVVAGALSGLAFLSTQKAVYFNVALGLALVTDAALARRYAAGLTRGALLCVGWALPVICYCLIFGAGAGPLKIAENLFLGPAEIATRGQTYVQGLDGYVWQTLSRNSLLYLACFAGLGLALVRIRSLDGRRRVALVFTAAITLLVFLHNQPWPYIFIMALPFLALWPLELYDALTDLRRRRLLVLAFGLMAALSFTRNIASLDRDNRAQLHLVASAEALLEPDETYFDGIGMLPNRRESARRWLDARRVHLTLAAGRKSDIYQALQRSPPKLIIRTYRTARIAAVIDPLLERGYVAVDANILMAGRELAPGQITGFTAPVSARYGLFDASGAQVDGPLAVDGRLVKTPVSLEAGRHLIGTGTQIGRLWLLPAGLRFAGFAPDAAPLSLFDEIYD